jgi:DNA topoisomerase III
MEVPTVRKAQAGGSPGMKVVLTEKPSVARDLAAFLGASQRREGYLEGGGYQVTWALGHLVELCEPEDYDPALRKWSLDALPIVPEEFRLRVIDNPAGRKQFAVVKRLLQGADEIIAATDAGREGELIFRYILEQAGLSRRPFRRLWLNSLSPAAVRSAFANLRPGAEFDRLYAAARCRSRADWIVGLNATRCFTVRYGGRGLLWSAGRVQTPVLALIAGRDDEIRAFRPETFYELWTTYRETPFKHDGDRFAKKEDAEALLARIAGHEFIVTRIEQKRRVEPPPQFYDLTDLQRDMNRRYGLSADQVLKAAQRLYEAKAITYPRTDSRYITADMKPGVRETLARLAAHKPAEIGELDLASLPFTARIVNDRKVSDHHAILPTGEWPRSLSGAEAKVFDAVVTRLIAAFYPPCVKLLTTVHGEANKVPLRATGVQVLEAGWTELYPKPRKRAGSAPAPDENDQSGSEEASDERDSPAEQPLPEFKQGERGPHRPFVKQGETKPPPHFTENTLLAAMETAGRLVDEEELKEALKERGLGTPATRASIIETLLARGYVRREKKNLVATDLGRYLIAVVRDPRLKSADLTGEWEARLKQIEQGRDEPPRFMEDIVRYTREIVQAGELTPIDTSRFGDCPRCGAAVIEGKRDLGCSRWREGCRFVLRRDFEGAELTAEQTRELLQRRTIAWRPSGEAGESLLYLSAAGAVFEIPKPSPEAASRSSKSATQGKRSGPGKRTSSRKSSHLSRTPAPRKPSKRGKAAAAPASESLGPCPLCGQPVVEQKKSYSCSGWRAGCPLVIWKTIAGKRISRSIAQALLACGETETLPGFKSKAGKPFKARLILQAARVEFAFDP